MKKFSFLLLAVFIYSIGFSQLSTKDELELKSSKLERFVPADKEKVQNRLDAFKSRTQVVKSPQSEGTSGLQTTRNIQAPPTMPSFSPESSKSPNVVIWSNDFSLPSFWSIQNLAGNTQNWVISTTGPTGYYSEQMGLPNSPSVANGFAMFDSDAIGNVNNILGSQNSVIQTVTPFSTIGYSNVRIKFHQVYRKFMGQTFVEFKIGTGIWQSVEVNANLNINDFGSDIVEVDVSSIIGNSANVSLRFRYYGEWDYAWMVDDVVIEESFTNDLAALYVFTLGEIPEGVGHIPKGLIGNVGAAASSAFTASLSVSGANTGTYTASVPSITSGGGNLVAFPSIVSNNSGANTLTLTLPNDNNNTNNTKSYHQVVGSAFSYADTSASTGGIGYNTGAGLMLSKFQSGNNNLITAAKVYIPSGTTNTGKTIYGVCLNSSGIIVASSPNYVIQTTDLETWKTLTFTTPVNMNNVSFYCGIAQVASPTEGFYPLGVQSPSYTHNDAFFTAALTGGTLTEANSYGRFMLGAVVGQLSTYDIGVVDLQIPGQALSCSLGTSESIVITIENFGTSPVSNFFVGYMINGVNPVAQLFLGSIAPGATSNFTFTTPANLATEGHYLIQASTALITDEDNSNDIFETMVVSGSSTIEIEILTDDYGYETYWGIFDSMGDLIYVDGGYDDNTTYNIELCAASTECYTFVLFDDYGDGIEAPGYYEVYYNSNLVGSNYNFTGSEDYVFNIGDGCLANDLGVDMVYTHGKFAKNHLSPHTVQALIFNYGTQAQTNVPVSLSITGANTYTTTYTIPSIGAGEEMIVNLSGFSPQNLGINDVTVSLPNDLNNSNNSASYYQEVTLTEISYADTSGIITSLGFGNTEGIIMNKYELSTAGLVEGVSLLIGDDISSEGQNIRGVLFNENMLMVAESPVYTIQSSDLLSYINLDFAFPFSLSPGVFYIGFAQYANPNQPYFPLGVQEETYARTECFYSANMDGTDTVSHISFGRFVIGANLQGGPVIETQNIELTAGWGIYSSYIVPDQPVLDSVFADIISHVQIVKSAAGAIFWPAWSVNGIGSWNNLEGYFINVTSPQTFIMEGVSIVPENSPISIPSGWSIIPYLRQEAAETYYMMTPILASLELMKDGYGGIFWPQWSVVTIDSLRPGLGYQVYMSSSAVFTYLSNTVQTKSINVGIVQFEKPSFYTHSLNTGNNMTFGIPQELLSRFSSQAELGVFDSRGSLVGSSMITNPLTAIAVWGTHENLPNPKAATSGEQLFFRVYNQGNEYALEVDAWSRGSGLYEKDGISVAKTARIVGNQSEFMLYPNPAKDILFVQLPSNADDFQTLSIYNLLGSMLMQFNSQDLTSNPTISIGIQNLPAGLYLMELVGKDEKLTKKFQISK